MKKFLVLMISLIFSMILISGGYGYWQKKIIIRGSIDVIKPPKSAASSIKPEDKKNDKANKEGEVVKESETARDNEVKVGENVGSDAALEAGNNVEDKVESTTDDSEKTDNAEVKNEGGIEADTHNTNSVEHTSEASTVEGQSVENSQVNNIESASNSDDAASSNNKSN